MPERVAEYRKLAHNCLAQAGSAADPGARTEFLKLAKGWQDLSNRIARELGLPLEDLPPFDGWERESA